MKAPKSTIVCFPNEIIAENCGKWHGISFSDLVKVFSTQYFCFQIVFRLGKEKGVAEISVTP
jgi:hypothetical protein